MEYKIVDKKKVLGVISGIACVVFAAGVIYNLFFSETKSVLFILQTVLQLFTAFFFGIYASGCFKGVNIETYSLCFVFPALWAAFRLLSIFMMATTFVNVSPILFELFALSFTMLFFFALGRTTGSIEDNGIRWRIMGFGFPCALFCYISSVPGLIAICIGRGAAADTNVFSCSCYLMAALFITSYLFSLRKKED